MMNPRLLVLRTEDKELQDRITRNYRTEERDRNIMTGRLAVKRFLC